jgi:hypothetical protein
MTLCISWIRKLNNHDELLIATDSRLRSFGSWNCGPKILTFPRTDCAICFEGDTSFAYPMMIQLQSAVANYPKANNRSQDLFDFKGHILKVLNDMLRYKSDYEIPDTSFLFGGYSWKKNKFALWQLYYEKHYKIFTHRPISFWRGVKGEIKVAFSGDYTDDAKQRLLKILKERNKLINGSLDMEPFEVLADMLKECDETKYPLIGGSPQLMKVYKHMNRTPIAVKWVLDDKPVLSLLGRPLLDYEKTSYPVIDTETMRIQRGDLIGQ